MAVVLVVHLMLAVTPPPLSTRLLRFLRRAPVRSRRRPHALVTHRVRVRPRPLALSPARAVARLPRPPPPTLPFRDPIS